MFPIKTSSRQRRSFQPALENLEDRTVPTVFAPIENVSILFPVFVHPAQLAGMESVPVNAATTSSQLNEFNPPLNITPIGNEIDQFNPPLNINPVPQIQIPGWFEVGLQPEPPTKPVANIAIDSGNAGILIGLLDQNKIDPQPEPPAPIEIKAIDESISNLFPVFTPNELNGILLPALSQELAASQELQNGVK